MANKKPHKLLQEKFLLEYISNGGIKLRAAKALGIDYSNIQSWFKNKDFVARVAEAESQWYDSIKAALMKRAMEKSDQAAFFFLKARYPEIYDDEVRRAKWMAENNVGETITIPIRALFAEDDTPDVVREAEQTTH